MACKHSNGDWYEHPEHPTTVCDRYSPHDNCPTCGFKSSRYSRNGACVVCSRNQAIAFYNTFNGGSNPLSVMVGRAPIEPDAAQWDILVPLYSTAPHDYKLGVDACDKSGHIGMRRNADGKCVLCVIEKSHQPRQVAIANGEKWYTPTTPCHRCGQIAQRSVNNGVCKVCMTTTTPSPAETSPRQEAIANGEKWYTPVKPCKQCGETALRSVANGECKGCRSGSGPTVSARKAAASAGESWYESEELCVCGRRQWKYVANGRVRRCACGV